MHNFFIVDPEAIADGRVIFAADQSLHIAGALRLGIGDAVRISDGHGRRLLGRIQEASKSRVVAQVLEEEQVRPPATRLTLYQSLLKAGKMEFVVEKTTEMGVSAFQPFTSSRSVPTVAAAKAPAKRERLKRIARAASEQSQRDFLPALGEIVSWEQMVSSIKTRELALLAWEKEAERKLVEALEDSPTSDIGLVIGPEGGFTLEEAEELISLGSVPVTLGPHTLRAETAAIAAVAIAVQASRWNATSEGT